MNEFLNKLNIATVTIKNLGYFLGAVVVIILGWDSMNDHVKNEHVHISQEERKTINDRFIEIEKKHKTEIIYLNHRIDMLEIKLTTEENRTTKRHNRQQTSITRLYSQFKMEINNE